MLLLYPSCCCCGACCYCCCCCCRCCQQCCCRCCCWHTLIFSAKMYSSSMGRCTRALAGCCNKAHTGTYGGHQHLQDRSQRIAFHLQATGQHAEVHLQPTARMRVAIWLRPMLQPAHGTGWKCSHTTLTQEFLISCCLQFIACRTWCWHGPQQQHVCRLQVSIG